MNSSTIPAKASQWAETLCKQPLPLLPHTGSRFLKELNASDISLAKLARQVENDPVLSLHLFSEAKNLRKNTSGEVTRLDHCLSMMGVTRVKKLANNIPVLKVARRSYCYQRYLSSIQHSQFAAHLTNSWSSNTFQRTDNPLHFPTLFYGCGAWFLWRFEFEKIGALENAIFNQGQSIEEAELDIFGCRIKEISAAIVQRSGLPSASQDALLFDWQACLPSLASIHRSEEEFDKRALISPSSHLNQLKSDTAKVCFANELAAQKQHHPYTHRYNKRIMKISAALLNRSLEVHQQKTQQDILSFSNIVRYPGIMPPVVNTLFLPKSNSPEKTTLCYLGYLKESDLKIKTAWQTENEKPGLNASKSSQANAPATSTSSKEPFSTVVPHLWKHLHDTSSKTKNLKLEELSAFLPLLQQLPPPANEADREETLKLCTTALTNYVGFPRIAFFGLLPDGTLAYQCGAGFQKQEIFLREPFPITPPQLISKLMKQPTGYWLKPENNDKILPILAKGITRISHDQGFVLMSIFEKNKPSGLFYCDRKGLDEAITEDQYKSFKQLCQTCTQAFSS